MQGLFGVVRKNGNCLDSLFLGTFGLQHRGQVYCGMAITDGEEIKIRTHRGLVIPSFENDLSGMDGFAGIGVTSSVDRQPLRCYSQLGEYVVGIDGYIKNAIELRKELFLRGHIFVTEQDVEIIATLIAEKPSLEEGIRYALDRITGPCNILLLSKNGLYVAKDLLGFKPLMLGSGKNSWSVASGSCAFNNGSGYKYQRDIEPGEIIRLDRNGYKKISKPSATSFLKRCSFEWIYYAEPDSIINGIPVARVRHNLGARLAVKDQLEFSFPHHMTVVGPVPNSGIIHAEGYHLKSGFPNVELFKPIKYVLRTYNLPLDERKRQKSRKLAPIRENIEGKIIILVDDSIRSAITITGIIKMLFDCGALEVHVRIACPNSIRYCPFDNPPQEEEEFIAATKSVKEIRQIIGATSLRFQELDEVAELIGLPKETLCFDCFINGD